MSPPKFWIDTSASFFVKCDVQCSGCVWFKCENTATWFWSNSWQKQIFFAKKHTISSLPVKPGPSIILGNYQKKQSWRNDFIVAVHNGLKKIRLCIPIFYFLFSLDMIMISYLTHIHCYFWDLVTTSKL